MPVRLDNPRQDVNSGKHLKRPIHGSPADFGSCVVSAQLGDELLGGEGAGVAQDCVNDRRTWRGEPIAVCAEHLLDLIAGEGLGL
jgi:hypothetical protein